MAHLQVRRTPPILSPIDGKKLPRTLSGLLEALGFDHSRVYVSTSQRYDLRPPTHRRSMSIWAREADHLEDLGQEAKRLYHRRIKALHHDDLANHDAAVWVNAIWTRLKRLFHNHGISL